MKKCQLLKKAKDAGFNSINDFVNANLHYLPKEKQDLFHAITAMDKSFSREKKTAGNQNGKG